MSGLWSRIQSAISALYERLMASQPSDPYIFVSLNRVLDDVVQLMSSELGKKNIALRIVFQPGEISLECREQLLKKSICHMLETAIDSASGSDEKWIEIHVTEYEDKVEILLTDSSPHTRVVFSLPIFQIRRQAA